MSIFAAIREYATRDEKQFRVLVDTDQNFMFQARSMTHVYTVVVTPETVQIGAAQYGHAGSVALPEPLSDETLTKVRRYLDEAKVIPWVVDEAPVQTQEPVKPEPKPEPKPLSKAKFEPKPAVPKGKKQGKRGR